MLLGALRIGAVPIPVNRMDRVDNYAYYLDDSYARVALVDAALLEPVLAERPTSASSSPTAIARGHVSFEEAIAGP